METPQNIISKLERLNDKLASVDSEKYVQINPDNLASTAASLAQVSSYVNKEFKEKTQSLNMDMDAYVAEIDAQVNAFMEKQKQELNEWMAQQLAGLKEVGINAAKAVLDFLPKISIPPTVQNALDMMEKIKNEVEEKILVATITLDLVKDNAMVTMIEKADKVENSFHKNNN
jgi:hypothetical protein